jgi:hypothetical protein
MNQVWRNYIVAGVMALMAMAGCQHSNKPPDAQETRTIKVPAVASTKPAREVALYRVADEGDRDEVEALAVGVAAAPSPDRYLGTDRKAAKISIANAQVEDFNDLKDLIATLPSKSTMVNHNPTITRAADSGRVEEEQRNVRVRAFLYAAKKEADNDFHLIIGRAPNQSEKYMTMELSGLPPTSSAAHPQLKAARDAFKAYFGSDLPGKSGYDFYDPPIPVEIQGSLFYDITHATGQAPGPGSLKAKMPTIWEVHPITDIVLEPEE